VLRISRQINAALAGGKYKGRRRALAAGALSFVQLPGNLRGYS
jgi:hypothetical protein